MIDELAKGDLHARLRDVRAAMLWKLEGLDEYDARRPLTSTGTNLLGLVKHLSVTEGLYFGDVFGRPPPDRPSRWWDDDTGLLPSMHAGADEPLAEVVDATDASANTRTRRSPPSTSTLPATCRGGPGPT